MNKMTCSICGQSFECSGHGHETETPNRICKQYSTERKQCICPSCYLSGYTFDQIRKTPEIRGFLRRCWHIRTLKDIRTLKVMEKIDHVSRRRIF